MVIRDEHNLSTQESIIGEIVSCTPCVMLSRLSSAMSARIQLECFSDDSTVSVSVVLLDAGGLLSIKYFGKLLQILDADTRHAPQRLSLLCDVSYGCLILEYGMKGSSLPCVMGGLAELAV
jgi:hypothetical protein